MAVGIRVGTDVGVVGAAVSVSVAASVGLAVAVAALVASDETMLTCAFALLGHWGRRRWVHRCALMLSLPLMVYVAVLFSHWSGPV